MHFANNALPTFRHPSCPPKGFENRRVNLTLLFGMQKKKSPQGEGGHETSAETDESVATTAGMAKEALERMPGVWYNQPREMQEVSQQDARQLRYCI